jgi:hypothetical protein
MQKPTFEEYLNQRLTAKERAQIVLLLVLTIGLCVVSLLVKPEFGALVSFVVGLCTLIVYFNVRGKWLKSIR